MGSEGSQDVHVGRLVVGDGHSRADALAGHDLGWKQVVRITLALFTLGLRTITPRPILMALMKKGSIVPGGETHTKDPPICKPFSMQSVRLHKPGIVPALGMMTSRLSADKHPFVAKMLLRAQFGQSATKGIAICSNPSSFTIFSCT